MKAILLLVCLAMLSVGTTAHLVRPDPATAQEPTIVYTTKPCNKEKVAGCYDTDRPNEIQVLPGSGEATIMHETLHFISHRDGHDWTECQVSYINFTRYGLEDAYQSAGYCKDGLPTGKSPKELD